MIKNWKKTDLGSIIKLVSGQHVKTNNYNEKGKGIPYLTGPTDFVGNHIKPTKHTTHPKAKSKENDILLTVKGSGVGKLAYSNQEYCISRQLMAIRPKSIESKFLFYYLQFSEKYFVKYARGLIPGISRDEVNNLIINVPPKIERDKIVEIIDQWSKAERKLIHLLESKESYKKGLMQRLLTGKKRFPEFEGEEWQEAKLKNFFKYYSNKNKDDEDLPVMSCSKVYGITRQENIFNNRVASNDISGYKIVEKDDLVYDPMLLWDASIGFVKEVERGVISPAYYTFKFKEGSAYRPFFEFVFGTHYMKYNYKAISQGTNTRRRKAPREAFLKIPVKIPKLIEEQKKIADTLLAAQKEIDLLEQEVELIKKQKKSLMQQLLTGTVLINEELKVTY